MLRFVAPFFSVILIVPRINLSTCRTKIHLGQAHVLVTSAFLIVEPSIEMYSRVEKHFKDLNVTNTQSNIKELLDMDIIHKEFGCKDEILVLPKSYATLDSDFR